MRTRYQPRNLDGRSGPVFEFKTLACYWIIKQVRMEGWDVELIRGEPLLIEIQEGLSR